jgi:hypothetical protein
MLTAYPQTEISVFADGSLQVDDLIMPPVDTHRYIGYRVLHLSEGGRITPSGMPCVNPSINVPSIEFDGHMQYTSYWLASEYNPNVTKDKWREVYKDKIAFTNNQGFEMSGDPRADFVNGVNLTSDLPKLMKAIICSGNFVTGRISGNELVMSPGFDAIDGNKPMPPVSEIMARHWYFHATTARWSAEKIWKVSNFPQGQGAPVLIPYILKEEARYPLSYFGTWNDYSLPDPLRIYSPK